MFDKGPDVSFSNCCLPYHLSGEVKNAEDLVLMNPEMFKDQADRRVSLGLIMAEIVKDNAIKVDDAKVRAKVEEIAEPYDEPEQVISWYYGDKQRIAEIESLVFEEQIIEWLLTKVTVDETMIDVVLNNASIF